MDSEEVGEGGREEHERSRQEKGERGREGETQFAVVVESITGNLLIVMRV